MVSLPGSRFAAAMSSPNVFQGRSEFTISSTVPVVTRVTGAKSRAGSSGIERRYRNLLAHRIEAEPSRSVYPSFSPLATTSAPRLPPAPPRFSTSTFCPRVVWSRSAKEATGEIHCPARRKRHNDANRARGEVRGLALGSRENRKGERSTPNQSASADHPLTSGVAARWHWFCEAHQQPTDLSSMGCSCWLVHAVTGLGSQEIQRGPGHSKAAARCPASGPWLAKPATSPQRGHRAAPRFRRASAPS